MKILIVDDDFVNRKIMQKYLEPYGVSETANDGEEAVKIFKVAGINGKPFDLMTLDIMMPKMDGLEVLKQIRAFEAEHKLEACKVIMTTALDNSKSVLTAFKQQCDSYLTKPIERTKLYEILANMGFYK